MRGCSSPGVLAVDDQVGVQHAQALDHLAGAQVVVDDDELGHQSVQQDRLEKVIRILRGFGGGAQNKSGMVAVKLETALPCTNYKTEELD